jgi:hypothetical protein
VSAVAEAPAATRLPGWGPAIRVGLSIWLLSRAVFLVGGFLITLIFGSARGKDAGLPVAVWPFRLYSNFDAGHFLRVAHYGYYPPPGRHLQVVSAPFLPGYPFTGRWVAQLLGFGTLTPAGLYTGLALVTWAGSAVAAVLIWRLTSEQADEGTATWATAILLLGPYSVFLMASYSEGPFLALALGAWLAARHDRWWLAGILAAAAALVRVNAIFLVAGLIVMYLLARRGRRVDAGGLLLGPIALFGYIAWLHSRTGSWTTWFLAQRIGWKRTTVTPWTALYNSVHRAVLDHDPAVRFLPGLDGVDLRRPHAGQRRHPGPPSPLARVHLRRADGGVAADQHVLPVRPPLDVALLPGGHSSRAAAFGYRVASALVGRRRGRGGAARRQHHDVPDQQLDRLMRLGFDQPLD